jgi:hypothetical protein
VTKLNMGGNALKNVKTIRLKKSLYDQVKTDIQRVCEAYSSTFRISFAFDLPNKLDFGDVDVLYEVVDPSFKIATFIEDAFHPVETFKSGDIVSFAYPVGNDEYAQVDFNKCTQMEFAQMYYSYGDANAILGHLLKYNGLGLCPEGLYMIPVPETVFPDDEERRMKFPHQHYHQKMIISSDRLQVLNYLGVDARWMEGAYTDPTEIMDAIIRCRFFHQQKYRFLNKASRQRSFRPFYHAFLHRLVELGLIPSFPEKCENGASFLEIATAAAVGTLSAASATTGNEYEDIDFEEEDGEEESLQLRQNYQMDAVTSFSAIAELERHRQLIISIMDKLELQGQRKAKYSGKLFLDHQVSERKIGKVKKEFETWVVETILQSNEERFPDFEHWLDEQNSEEVMQTLESYLATQSS